MSAFSLLNWELPVVAKLEPHLVPNTLRSSVLVCRARVVAFAGIGKWGNILIHKISQQHKTPPVLLVKEKVENVTKILILEQAADGIDWEIVTPGLCGQPSDFRKNCTSPFAQKISRNTKFSSANVGIYREQLISSSVKYFGPGVISGRATKFFYLDMSTQHVLEPVRAYTISPVVYQDFEEMKFMLKHSENTLECYDWIGQRHFRVEKMEHGSFALVSTDKVGHLRDRKFQSTALVRNLPIVHKLQCLPLSSQVLWTFKSSQNKFSLRGLNYFLADNSSILQTNGLPMSCQFNSDLGSLSSANLAILTWRNIQIPMVVKNNSILAVDILHCRIKTILSSEFLTSIGVCNIKSIAVNMNYLVIYDACHRITSLDVSWGTTDVSQGNNVKSKSVLEYIDLNVSNYSAFSTLFKMKRHISIEEGGSFNDYPSVLFREFNVTENIEDIFLDNSPSQSTRLSSECLYPIVSAVSANMLSISAASVTVNAEWNTSDLCRDLSKPAVTFRLQYILAPRNVSITNQTEAFRGLQNMSDSTKRHVPNSFCLDMPNLKQFIDCSQKTVGPTRNMTVKFALENLKPHYWYWVEVSVIPDIDEELIKTYWFADEVYSLEWANSFDSRNNFKWVGRQPHGIHFASKYKPKSFNVAGIIAGSISAILFTVILSASLLICQYRRKKRIYTDLLRIHKSQVALLTVIGEGHFGTVWKGTFNGDKESVELIAVKLLKPNAAESSKRQFLEEALILGKLKGHGNIVEAMGLCLDTSPRMFVLEFVSGGSLLSFLRDEQKRRTVKVQELLRISRGVNAACCTLEEKGYIHRDIAARNVLMEGHIPKLADFGLAKDEQDSYNAGIWSEFPIPWTAPEGFYGNFTIKSDVWSFGVLMYEIFSWGARPYGACGYSAELHDCPMEHFSPQQIETNVCVMRRSLNDIEKPCSAMFPAVVEEIMNMCWVYDPKLRPSFQKLKVYLEGSLGGTQTNEGFVHQEVSAEKSEASRVASASLLNDLMQPHYYQADHDQYAVEMTPVS